jgi:hypothetical protein
MRVGPSSSKTASQNAARREQAARFIASAIRADRWDVRSLGTTLALPYLASGRISAYVVFWASAIHTGVGSLLVTEAGGTLSDIDGRSWTIRSDSVVGSANSALHQELLDLARSASGPRSESPPVCMGKQVPARDHSVVSDARTNRLARVRPCTRAQPIRARPFVFPAHRPGRGP